MPQVSRRDFLRSIGLTGAAATLAGSLPAAARAAIKALVAKGPPVIWLSGGTCGGCSISALNAQHPAIDEVITSLVTLHYHLNLSAVSGEQVFAHLYRTIEEQKGRYIFVQEGVIPTAFGGRLCIAGEYKGKRITMLELARHVASKAELVVAAGSCPSFGGIPSAPPNPTGVEPLSALVPQTVINIPGCPVHPDDLFGALLYYLKHGAPELDHRNRPRAFFPNLHETCPLLPEFEKENFARHWGDHGRCTATLGCLGPTTHCGAGNRGWNGGISGCIQCGSRCIGCTEPDFARNRAGFFDSIRPDDEAR